MSGLIAGVLVLGISGRIAMRVIALASDEDPRFTVVGSLVVLAVFGLLSAPLGLAFAFDSTDGSAWGLIVESPGRPMDEAKIDQLRREVGDAHRIGEAPE